MKDLWLLIVGDMPTSLQWIGAIAGFMLALSMLAVGKFGYSKVERPNPRHLESSNAVNVWPVFIPLERLAGPVSNAMFWLFTGTLLGYLASVIMFHAWPWSLPVAVALAIATWRFDRWYQRHILPT